MRTECIEALTSYARAHPDVMLLTADLGYSVLEHFAEALPAQYANVGVCEQAMAGIAAGLALSGRGVACASAGNDAVQRQDAIAAAREGERVCESVDHLRLAVRLRPRVPFRGPHAE